MAVTGKIVLVAVGLICAMVTPQVTASRETMEKCMTESGATSKMLADFMQGENGSREVKCLFKCIMTTAGKMNEDGTFNMEAMQKVQTPALYKIASTTCANFETADLCEKAYAHISCLRDNAKEELTKVMQH